MPPKRKQIKSTNNKRKTIKRQCKQSRKRTGESLDDIIQRSLVKKRESTFSKAARLGLKIGGLGLGLYALTHQNNVRDFWGRMSEEAKELETTDDNIKTLHQLWYQFSKKPKDGDYEPAIKTLNGIFDKIAAIRSPNAQKLPEDLKNKKFKEYKNPKKIIEYIEKLYKDYTETFNGYALSGEDYNDSTISSINKWIQDPSSINYKDAYYWLPKTKNMIWSLKPGAHISDLEGNISEYLKTEDTFKNIVENAKNKETGEADRQKLDEMKQYMGDLVKRYKETFNLT